ncbi:MAG: hypothetical protein HY075_03045 [Deltaproteobacteria bacterium]|nr:hypothetical protein [Deltaproteobacteria bacterium]
MKRTNTIVLSVALGALALGGCHAEDRSAPKSNVVAPVLQELPVGSTRLTLPDGTQDPNYDPHSHTFQNNKAFFWREGTSGEQSAAIQIAAKAVDPNDDAGIAARDVRDGVSHRLDLAKSALDEAMASLDDATKNAISAARTLLDENTTMLTEAQQQSEISRWEKEIADASAKIELVSRDLPKAVRDTLAQLGKLGADAARLPSADSRRDALKQQIDDLTKTLPADLSTSVVNAKTARDAALVQYETAWTNKYRRPALNQELEAALKAVPKLPDAVAPKYDDVVALYRELREKEQTVYVIGERGRVLVDTIIANTEYLEKRLSRVTVKRRSSGVEITLVDFPEQDMTMATENGTITNASFRSRGGFLTFEVHPVAGEAYYLFKLSRTRTEIKDGRVFFQGEMNLCTANGDCEAKHGSLIKHGIAKFATSN